MPSTHDYSITTGARSGIVGYWFNNIGTIDSGETFALPNENTGTIRQTMQLRGALRLTVAGNGLGAGAGDQFPDTIECTFGGAVSVWGSPTPPAVYGQGTGRDYSLSSGVDPFTAANRSIAVTLVYDDDPDPDPDAGVANSVRGTLGVPSDSSTSGLEWGSQSSFSALTIEIPSSLRAVPATGAFLRRVRVTPFGLVVLEFSPTTTTASSTAGPRLSAAWEVFEAAIAISAGGVYQTFPGPRAPGGASTDASEPYQYNTGQDYSSFITAYRALSDSQRAATQITLQDGRVFPSLTFTAGVPRMSAQLADRVDIAATMRAGSPRLETIVDWPIAATLRAGRPSIDVTVIFGIIAEFRAGLPRMRAVPGADIPVLMRAGVPRMRAIPGADIPVTFRAGLPRYRVAVTAGIVPSFRAGSPQMRVVVEQPVFATMRAGVPRIEAHPVWPIAAALRAGVPRMRAIPGADIPVTFRAGVPGFVVSLFPPPERLVGFFAELEDEHVVLNFEPYIDPAGVPITYEYDLGDGNWVPFVPIQR